jgi:GNAT superfamily N-acetyltransferase
MISVPRIKMAAKDSLRQSVTCYQEADRLDVDEFLRMVSLSYVSGKASNGGEDFTGVQLTFHPDKNVMWIRNLRVASMSRSNGLGRQLAHAAEHLARQIGVHTINLFPLTPARTFWQKLGYAQHPRVKRVLTKRLRVSARGEQG